MRLVVRIISGLGNQIFQYAAGLYFAKRMGAQLELATPPQKEAGFLNPGGNSNSSAQYADSPYLLSVFNLTSASHAITFSERILQARNQRVGTVGRTALSVAGQQFLEEPEQYRFSRDLPVRPGVRKLLIRGYWQARQYAEANAAQLRDELTWIQPPAGKNLELLSQIHEESCAVSLHIRRGDYLRAVGGSLALPLSYYDESIRFVLNRFPQATFYVFSDDIGFAKQSLPAYIRAVFVDHNPVSKGHEDLRLLSGCRHHIISNSTFSWWGAWLGSYRDKVVVAPKYWKGKQDSYYPDLFPSEWTLIDNISLATAVQS